MTPPSGSSQATAPAEAKSALATASIWRMTATEWLICAIASIGFAFDTYTLLVLTVIARPALNELLPANVSPIVVDGWIGNLFYIPAVAGGIFGLLGGYLIDLLGRRRILTWSILLYAACTFGSAYVTTPLQFLLLRCGTFIGVSVEFVAATAWLAELFTQREQREAVIGITQAFASTGGLLISSVYYLVVTYSQRLPLIHGEHQAWRYAAMSGLIPAIPLIVLRPFLPESPIWRRKKSEGTLKRPSFAELFRPQFRKTALITCLMMACSYGASFGMLQHFARIIPGTPGVRILSVVAQEQRVGFLQGMQEAGGLAGRVVMAILAVFVISRRRLLRVFQIPGLLLVPLVMFLPALRDRDMSTAGIFALGFLTVAQFSYWGNYLPLVYPTYLRGTGEAFAANIGGRMVGTSAAKLVTWMVQFMPGGRASRQLAYAAGIVGLLAYVVGFIASFWLPEPSLEATPD